MNEIKCPLKMRNQKIVFKEDDGRLVGQQYLSDTGPIDILALKRIIKKY